MRNPWALAAVLSTVATPLLACEAVQVGDLRVDQAWSRATIGAERPAVVYVRITNTGGTDDALVGLSSPVAGMPMLHETVVTDGTASMPHVMSIPVPGGQTVELAPGGYHGMLMDLTTALKEGESFDMTLTFEKAGQVTVPVEVLSMRADTSSCAGAD